MQDKSSIDTPLIFKWNHLSLLNLLDYLQQLVFGIECYFPRKLSTAGHKPVHEPHQTWMTEPELELELEGSEPSSEPGD